jgi:hypothetical protein
MTDTSKEAIAALLDALEKRLRRADEYEPLGHDGWEAADTIAALAARVAELEAALDDVSAAGEGAAGNHRLPKMRSSRRSKSDTTSALSETA